MNKVKIIEVDMTEYHLEEDVDKAGYSKRRTAIVYSKNGRFDSCKYGLIENDYSYEDWCFLAVVGDFIRGKFKDET